MNSGACRWLGDWNSPTVNAATTNRAHNDAHEISTVGASSLTDDIDYAFHALNRRFICNAGVLQSCAGITL
ncbi:hypothetical protein AB1L42_04360 [Thalassoglobus sp. JC818]|uniref:hypothetical protein n=1 Tax=Thalassoglobus sp. JC818 TaxID=3232136 RepID=UPI003457F790